MPAWRERLVPLAGHPAARLLRVERGEWLEISAGVLAGGGVLLGLWGNPARTGSDAGVCACWLWQSQLLVLALEVALAPAMTYPSLASLVPAAARMERATADLMDLRSDAPDQRPWLRHRAWGTGSPLAGAMGVAPAPAVDDYPFLRVSGEGVHEIPVGPVHAGIIEPGHFRFSVVGEKVLRLEERFGYVHKGIEWRLARANPAEAARLVGRVSGDSTVAYAWAFCQAFEGLARAEPPPRALALRALCLEIERLQNHLGDLGALFNDAGFAFGLMQFSRLKEQLLRALEPLFARRYLFDVIVPGGVALDPPPEALSALVHTVRDIGAAVNGLREIGSEHAGLRDRLDGAGIVTPALARRLGLVGLAARASGQHHDLRHDAPAPPYPMLAVSPCVRETGDVAARVDVRFEEIQSSIRCVQALVREWPTGPVRVALGSASGEALGAVEGWRGPVLVWLAMASGRIERCHPHDPSWQNWPVLEHAIIGNIVPDFPLINKSFNLSYSGHDL